MKALDSGWACSGSLSSFLVALVKPCIEPGGWRGQSIADFALFVLQFDFVELLDGRRLLTQEARSLEVPQRQSRGAVPPSSHETGFIQYLDSGIWHLAFYNDGKESEVVSFLTTAVGKQLRPLVVSLDERKVVDSGVLGDGKELKLNRLGIGTE